MVWGLETTVIVLKSSHLNAIAVQIKKGLQYIYSLLIDNNNTVTYANKTTTKQFFTSYCNNKNVYKVWIKQITVKFVYV